MQQNTYIWRLLLFGAIGDKKQNLPKYETMKYNFEFSYRIRNKGVQWLSGRMLDLRPRGHGVEPHRRHCVVVFEQDTFILA